LFGQLNPVVTPSARDVAGGAMLFYTEALVTERWTDDQRSLDQLVHASSNLTAAAQKRGMSLLFVLVPDKERIYADALPEYARQSVRPTILPEVERRFRAAGLNIVNLLPAFQSAAQNGELLFWRDDTHWNPRGVRLAVEMVAPAARGLLDSP
jgi:alginate O-acetyltransferase complex protein AlgJ